MTDSTADNPTETSPSPKEHGPKGEILPSRRGRFDGGRLGAVLAVTLSVVFVFTLAAVADLVLRDRPIHGEVANATVRVAFDQTGNRWNLELVKDGRSIGMERCNGVEYHAKTNGMPEGKLARTGCWEAHSSDGLDAILNYTSPWKSSNEFIALSLDGGQSWEDMRCGEKTQSGVYMCFNLPPKPPIEEIPERGGGAMPY